MNFAWTQEQEILRDTVREFALSEIAPHSTLWDSEQAFPPEIFKKLGELGMLGVLVDPEFGGAGLGYPEYALVIEELSRVDGSIGLSVAAHNSLCTNHIYQEGTDRQKEKYVKPLASGEALGAWALTEPGAGSDAVSARTQAVKRDGSWWINGTKCFCTHGSHADVYVILAVTAPGKGAHGMSAFIVEKDLVPLIYQEGTDRQKEKYVKPLASGEALGAWALTEPGAGSDAVSARTQAVKRDGSWWINGTKCFCTHGSHADVYVILAVTAPGKGAHGMSAFIVEKGTKGLIPGKKEDKLGCRASDTASLTLEDCRIPQENILGHENEGFVEALKILDGGRISIASMGVGIAQGASDCAKLGVAPILLGGIVSGVAVAPVDLNGLLGDPHCGFAGEEFGHGRVFRDLPPLLFFHPGGSICQ